MTKRTQLDEIRLLRRALADLYMVHTGLGTLDRWGALAHLHCKAGTSRDVLDTKKIESGVVKATETALRETAAKGY